MNLKDKKICFLGDSITAGVGTSEGENSTFWSIIGRCTGAITRGFGISGTTIARQFDILYPEMDEHPFYTRINQIDDDADIIVVFGGTNDYGHGDAPLGKMSDLTTDTFYGAMNLLCQSLIERFPQSLIIIMTPLHRLKENVDINERNIRNVASLQDYVEAERRVAEYYGIPVFDAYSTSGLQPNMPKLCQLYMPDGLHPNDLGHQRLADRMIGFLSAL